jgi:hypothetical protein
VVYWAIFTFAFSLLWTISLYALDIVGVWAALSLVIPVILGVLVSILLYFNRDRQILEYDDDGYEIVKGRRNVKKARWSEFSECSVIRYGYARKVRGYTRINGTYSDVDSSASGVDPFLFRDFMQARIRGREDTQPTSDIDLFDGLEVEIHHGRAGWVADLNETFREHQVLGETFPLVARGTTRPRGFLLSRFIAMTIMPNYDVCLYAHDLRNHERMQRSHIMRLIRIIESQRDEKNIKWSWLLLFHNQELPASLVRIIEEFGEKDVGIGSIDVRGGKLMTSSNQLGRSLARQMRMQHLMKDLRRRT